MVSSGPLKEACGKVRPENANPCSSGVSVVRPTHTYFYITEPGN